MENEQELEVIAELKGTPYFIDDRGEGKFSIVKSLSKDIKQGKLYFNFENEILQIGLDMRETPARNLQLLVEGDNNMEHYFINIINECRKFAGLSRQDYVTIEPYGNIYTRYLIKMGNISFYAVRPRIFRKIYDD